MNRSIREMADSLLESPSAQHKPDPIRKQLQRELGVTKLDQKLNKLRTSGRVPNAKEIQKKGEPGGWM